jgi:hypothetical protein
MVGAVWRERGGRRGLDGVAVADGVSDADPRRGRGEMVGDWSSRR